MAFLAFMAFMAFCIHRALSIYRTSNTARYPPSCQAVGAVAVLAVSFIGTLVIGFVIHKVMGFRITEEDEVGGIDLVEHAETGYDLTPTSSGVFRGGPSATTASKNEAEVSA